MEASTPEKRDAAVSSPESSHIVVVKTSIGDERIVAEAIAGRAKQRGAKVRSVVSPANLHGYLLAETDDADEFKNLVKGIPKALGVVEGSTGIGEISHFLTPKSYVAGIEEGDLVELVSGPYKGEKARVRHIDEATGETTVEPPEEKLPYWQRGSDEGGFKRLLFLVTIVALVIMIIVASYGLARINRTFGAKPAHLYFDAVYVKLDANVTFDIYLSNDGETDSGSLELVLHALKAGAGTQVIGGEASLKDLSVPKRTTQSFSATLALPHDDYDVRIDLFEDGKLLLQKKINLSV